MIWRVTGSSTQESEPGDDEPTRMPKPRTDPSLKQICVEVIQQGILKETN